MAAQGDFVAWRREPTDDDAPPSAHDGGLTFDATGERLGPATTAEAFAALRAAHGARLTAGHVRTRAELPRAMLEGAEFHLTAVFEDSALARIELVMARAADGSSWADWSRDAEMTRKREHEAWALRTFGTPLAPKPLALDRRGEPIVPEPLTWEHPSHAVFPWGEVISSYDSRAGSAVLIVRYGPTPPLQQA